MSSEYPLFDYALHEMEDDKLVPYTPELTLYRSKAADDWFNTLRETIHAPLFATASRPSSRASGNYRRWCGLFPPRNR